MSAEIAKLSGVAFYLAPPINPTEQMGSGLHGVTAYCCYRGQQSHHHNGDHAARRPRMTCSICGRQLGCNFEGGFSTPGLGLGGCGGRGWAHSIARPWIPIISLLTHMVYLLPFFKFFFAADAIA